MIGSGVTKRTADAAWRAATAAVGLLQHAAWYVSYQVRREARAASTERD